MASVGINTGDERDANGNAQFNNSRQGFTTVATAGSTTTLTVASAYLQFLTGTLAQIVTLPDVTTLVPGHQFYIRNNSTGLVTINSSGGSLVRILGPGTRCIVTCILTTGTTAASWSAMYLGLFVTDGKVLSASNSLTLAGTDGTTMTFPASNGTVLTDNATQTVTGSKTFTNDFNFFGGGTGTGQVYVAYGATVNGATKTVRLGTSGASGSTTNIDIGSSAGGALGAINLFGPTIVAPTADWFCKLPAPTSISGAATLTIANLQPTIVEYTGAAAAITFPTGATLDTFITNVNTAFEFSVINTGSGVATMTANTGVTIVGAAAVANGTSARWAIRRSGLSTYVAYRLT